MGWIKEIKQSNDYIFKEITSKIKEWKGIPNDSSSPYEYFTDYLRDYFNLTLKQSDEICEKLRKYYRIKNFYYNGNL